MIDEPWIALLGDPMEGYTVFGPCDKQRAYSIDDSWVFPLEKPPAGDDAGYDPKGMIVVFDGNIGRGFERGGWLFYGPFRDDEAAAAWIDERTGPGYAGIIKMESVEEVEPAA